MDVTRRGAIELGVFAAAAGSAGLNAAPAATESIAPRTTPSAKTRIAILGGGAGALAAAYAITSSPCWSERYDITIYEMSWRLGGKGATARDPEKRHRNQEHGLHVLGGFYHNALALLRDCYAQWPSVSSDSMPFEDTAQPGNGAFLPQFKVDLMDKRGGLWQMIEVPLVSNGRKLGMEPVELSPLQIIKTILDWIFHAVGPSDPVRRIPMLDGLARNPKFLASLAMFKQQLPAHDPFPPSDDRDPALLSHLEIMIDAANGERLHMLVDEHQPDYLVLLLIAFYCFKGMIRDSIWHKGFDAINDKELKDWMAGQGAGSDITGSCYVRAGYDYVFAYKDGDTQKPQMAAGVGLRAFFRMLCTYNDTMFVNMNGGMGEVVFLPLYDILKKRNVHFKFFHRVDSISLSADGRTVEKIGMTQQAKILSGDYDPFVPGGKRRTWPHTPKYDLLDVAPDDAVTTYAEDKWESPWWDSLRKSTFDLVAGKDFDLVLCAIPSGALPLISADLSSKNARWAQMLNSQQTVNTVGIQLWLADSLATLKGLPTIVTAHVEPLATWADMSFLLRYEDQPPGAPRQLSYLCGPIAGKVYSVEPPAPNAREAARADAKKAMDAWLGQNLWQLLPGCAPGPNQAPSQGEIVDWFVHPNTFPSEQYVMSPPGSIDNRIRAGETGMANLFVAGDWVRTGTDAGSFETAVMSGLQASRAICGYPKTRIVGETDFP